MMDKLKRYLVLSSFLLFCCIYAWASATEPPKDNPVSLEEETIILDRQVEDIKLEHRELHRTQPEQNFKQTEKSTGKGKSILNTARAKPDVSIYSQKIPKTSLEAEKLGWKKKTVKTPQPLTSLVKEVPKEIEVKKAILKQRQNKK